MPWLLEHTRLSLADLKMMRMMHERNIAMSYRTKHLLLMVALFSLLLPLFSSCGSSTTPSGGQHTATTLSNRHTATPGNGTPQPQNVVLSNCRGSALSPSVTTLSPSSTQRSIYFGGGGNLYALSAQTGRLRWCIHVSITGGARCTRPIPCLPPPFVMFGTPTVVDGIVYVCASGGGETGYLYAFNASDSSLRWRTQTDCWIVAMPFGDNAIPLVNNGVVYSGLYAVRAQDGEVLWKETHINLSQEGELILLAVADGVVYGCTEGAVYAINARDGSILWRYPPHAFMTPGGPLAVSNQMLFVGTQGSVDQPETSALYVINTQNGSLRWYKLMGDYVGTAFLNNVAYVSSRDQYLYALNMNNGTVLWRHKFIYPTNPALAMNGALYINSDGAYALDSTNGSILWHKPLGASQSVGFIPSTVVDGVDYLGSGSGGQEGGTLYALNASTGAEYWHISNLNQVSPMVVV